MTSANSIENCCCRQDPCRCPKPIGGCIADLCPPRPCFFSGQLVTAEDLNAVMAYFMARDALFAKLHAGWGVLGGMRLTHADTPSFGLFGASGDEEAVVPDVCLSTLAPNPKVVAGPTIRVSAGAAIDAGGRTLTLCQPTDINVATLSSGVGGMEETRDCGGWFGSFCAGLSGSIRARQFWVVARRRDTPTRLAPVLAESTTGTPETCNFTRTQEDVEISLVRDIPLLYFLHGCLTSIDIPCVDELVQMLIGVLEMKDELDSVLNGSATAEIIAALASASGPDSATAALTNAFGGVGFKLVPQLIDFINSIPVNTCCTNPGVVLGRVLLATEVPSGVRNALGNSLHYVFLDDAFPYRRLVPNGATRQVLWTALASILVTAGETLAPNP